MAAVHSKELFLGWYFLTLELRQTVKSRLPKKSTYVGEIVPDYELRPPESEWVISIDDKLSIEEKLTRGRQDNMPGSWANLSIYRIPRYLKHGEDKAWVPQIVSLGPYHHGDKHLRHMERHKWRCLHRILERSGQGISLYLDSVKKVERRARVCYEGRISMSRDEFVDMMVLDGCFVIEMFRGFAKGFENLGYPRNDPVFSMRGLILQIQRDMIMLENQIPLFILDRLLSLQLGDPNRKERVTELANQFFSCLMPCVINLPHESNLNYNPLDNHGAVHCLEVFRRSHLQLGPERSETKQWLQNWSQRRQQLTHCLTELRECGIKIKSSQLGMLGEIKFKDGILRIPMLDIHKGTMSLFLNLIAFEQSHFNCRNHITSFVIFMHNLINSPEDVRCLRDREIINHCLGSDAEVVDLFHRLCQDVAFNFQDSYLWDISCKLIEYCKGYGPFSFPISLLTIILFSSTCREATRELFSLLWSASRAFLTRKWNAWLAILKNKYFDNPWSIISLIAAFVLLVLTCIQSFYAVYAYYRRRS